MGSNFDTLSLLLLSSQVATCADIRRPSFQHSAKEITWPTYSHVYYLCQAVYGNFFMLARKLELDRRTNVSGHLKKIARIFSLINLNGKLKYAQICCNCLALTFVIFNVIPFSTETVSSICAKRVKKNFTHPKN